MMSRPPSTHAILNIPVELQLLIIQELHSLEDAISLSSTCKHFHSLLNATSVQSILRKIGCYSFPSFIDALCAIRAVTIPEDTLQSMIYYQHSIKEPDSTESSRSRPNFFAHLASGGPTLAEVSSISKLRVALDSVWRPKFNPNGVEYLMKFDETFMKWEREGANERFYRGAFRYISYSTIFSEILYPPIRETLRKTGSTWELRRDGPTPWESDLEVLAGSPPSTWRVFLKTIPHYGPDSAWSASVHW